MMPAFAVVKKARAAATLSAMRPELPMVTAAPSEIGVSEPDNCSASRTPTVTNTMRT